LSPGETTEVNMAWGADNDGDPRSAQLTSQSPASVVGIKLLGSSNPDAKISYNWLVSHSEGYPKDWGPWLKSNQEKWEKINPYGSGIYFPDSAMGTPGGDRSKYFLLSNGEIDFDQMFTDTLPKVDTSWVKAAGGWSKDLADGIDQRFLYSFGPFDIPPGDTIFAAVALVAGENLHTDPANRAKNLPDNPYLYYENLDFSDLVSNAQKALEVYQSGYALPPPGPPEDFKAFPLIGTGVKLTWSAKRHSNLRGYNIYRSLRADDPNPEIIKPEVILDEFYIDEAVTEGENYIYWIASVDQNHKEGMRVKTEVLAGRPRAPWISKAAASKDQVVLSFSGIRERDIVGYKVYRSDYNTTLMIDSVSLATDYIDRSVTNGVIYYYQITAVDLFGLESFFSDSVYALPMAFDRGIGVFDRTPIDWMHLRKYHTENFGCRVDSFYHRIFQHMGCPWDYLVHDNHDVNWKITLQDLSPYPVVVIHSEAIARNMDGWTDSTAAIIRHYLNAGGRLIFGGTNNYGFFFTSSLSGEELPFCDPIYLARRDSLFCQYLFLDQGYIPVWKSSRRTEEFIGAFSIVSEYPHLEVDPEKPDSEFRILASQPEYEFEPLEGKLPGVGYIIPKDRSVYPVEVIYTFHSAYDTSDLAGKPVAVRYLGDDYKFVFFNFPLYFIKEQQAMEVMQQALRDLGIVPTSVPEEGYEALSVADFSLEQNYPNPFNSITTIPFTVHGKLKTEGRPLHTTLKIYNILGQKVRTLLDEKKKPGCYEIVWDGKDEKGNEVGSGVYLYRLKAGDYEKTKKMILLK